MNKLIIHDKIKKKLNSFIDKKKIPHIIFHGPSGAGKRNVLNYFVNKIYKTTENIKNYVMYINCAHGKGIKFIRNELKFFAKTNIHLKQGEIFKSIVLFNADKLTTDAQSALRRCIEQFSHTTRFFIVLENKNKLLKPIISRFCNIFIPFEIINDKKLSLHVYKKELFFEKYDNFVSKKEKWLYNKLETKTNYDTIIKCSEFCNILYEKGYSGLDILNYIKKSKCIKNNRRFALLLYFNKIRKEFRNEYLLIFFIINIAFMRTDLCLENIEEM